VWDAMQRRSRRPRVRQLPGEHSSRVRICMRAERDVRGSCGGNGDRHDILLLLALCIRPRRVLTSLCRRSWHRCLRDPRPPLVECGPNGLETVMTDINYFSYDWSSEYPFCEQSSFALWNSFSLTQSRYYRDNCHSD